MKTEWAKQFGAAAIAAFVAVGCSGGGMSGQSHGHMAMAQSTASDAMMTTSATKAADLRAGLNYLLGEHILLASSATGAALAGRDAQFKAAAAALDQNSVDISKAIGSVYGQGAEDAFLPLWRRHIGFVVDYTVGVATKDKAKQDKAVADLVQYTQDFGAFLASANPNLPKDAVAELVKGHVLTLKDGSRAGRGRPAEGLRGDADRVRSHGDDRRPAGRRHSQAVPGQVPRIHHDPGGRPPHDAHHGVPGAYVPGRPRDRRGARRA
jgi:hypothetical protein